MATKTIKILHISDVQLGRNFPQLGKAGDLVRSAIKETFERTIKVALDEGVDGVIIAGNLFAANLISRNLIDFAVRQIERLGRIPVVLVPGSADALDETSVYRQLRLRRLPDNLTILGVDGKLSADFPDLGFTVYGIPAGSTKQQLPSDIKPAGLQILVLSTGVISGESGELELSPLAQEASSAGRFNYVAVGGSVGFNRWSDNTVSSGSPEGIDFVEGDAGRALIVQISEETVDLAHREVGKLKWVDYEFNSENFRYTLEIERELQSKVDTATIMRARLTGRPSRDGFVDLPSLRKNFSEKFCRFVVIDEREFDERLIDEMQESSSSLVNEFAALVREGYDNAPQELQKGYLMALTTGRALLSGKDVM